MTTTEVAVRENGSVSLFPGTTPAELIEAATDVANRFSDIVKRQRLYKSIAGRDHVLVEGWQTVGSLVGVYAVKDDASGVVTLAWPPLEALGPEPPPPGPEPRKSSELHIEWERRDDDYRAWLRLKRLHEARAAGLAYGFSASWRAVKDDHEVGWGEGRCTRAESNWATKDDFQLASQAQTRGQSRTLAAPLRFIVKLAGYATTPADDMPDEPAAVAAAAEIVLDEEGAREVAAALQERWPQYDGHGFVRVLGRRYEGAIPEAAGVALRAFAWWVDTPAATGADAAPATPEQATEAESEESAPAGEDPDQ